MPQKRAYSWLLIAPPTTDEKMISRDGIAEAFFIRPPTMPRYALFLLLF